LVVVATCALSACGQGDADSASTQTAAVPAPPPVTTATATASSTAPTAADISKDRSTKPAIPKPTGTPPEKLVVEDVVKGTGKAVRRDDLVSVQYVGISYSTGVEFDASWNGGKPVQFPLSQGQLIDGWVQGIPGMKIGGRRLLIIPPGLAYGAEGRPPQIGPNETLVFVIDLVNATPASG